MGQNLAQTAVKAQENVVFGLCSTIDDCAQTSGVGASQKWRSFRKVEMTLLAAPKTLRVRAARRSLSVSAAALLERTRAFPSGFSLP
jgi:hypothetical protein